MAIIPKCLMLICLLLSPLSYAHKFSTAYLDVSEKTQQPFLLWKVSLHDLASANLLGALERQISWQQVTAAEQTLAIYIAHHILFYSNAVPCTLQLASATSWQTQRVQQQTYVLFPVQVTCQTSEGWQLHYDALFETEHSHKLLLRWKTSYQQAQVVLSEQQPFFPSSKE